VQRAFAERLDEREHAAPPDWPRWLDAWLSHLEETLRASADLPAQATEGLLLRLAPRR
jgi:hypothetical protein